MPTPPLQASSVRAALAAHASRAKALASARFFKTGPGQYGEGDRFLGLTVPEIRRVVAAYRDLPLDQVVALLKGGAHEERLAALLIWVAQYRKTKDQAVRVDIVKAYLTQLRWVNNWDLVDSSARDILGHWLQDKDRRLLYRMIASPVLWERRVAMIATFHFINQGESRDALALAAKVLKDPEDLIHKASGWMLREVGKRVSREDLRGFLRKHAGQMPRTMLRYAIEHLPAAEKRHWMTA